MPTTQYLAFGTGAGANTLSYSAWQALGATVIATGFQSGTADSQQFNTLMRQVSVAAAGLARFSADNGLLNMNDDGNVVNFAAGIKSAIDQLILNASVTAGIIAAFGNPVAPAGWLECNGAAVSRATYARLFAAIGDTWGVGDGSTTFNLPDLRGEFLRGWDNGRGVDPARAFRSFQADALASHTHQLTTVNAVESTDLGNLGESGGTVDISTGRILTGATGGTETRPRNVAVMYCIKF